ncbi:MAG: hypothetical protein ACTSWC_10410 [Promethearchaeota archaeon]
MVLTNLLCRMTDKYEYCWNSFENVKITQLLSTLYYCEVITINLIKRTYQKLLKHNLLSAILITDVIFSFLFLLNPFMIFISGDLDFLLSLVTGMLYISKTRKKEQNGYLLFIKAGIFGGFIASLSAIVISIIQQPPNQNSDIVQIFLIFTLLGQFIGLFLALLSSISFYFKSAKKDKI